MTNKLRMLTGYETLLFLVPKCDTISRCRCALRERFQFFFVSASNEKFTAEDPTTMGRAEKASSARDVNEKAKKVFYNFRKSLLERPTISLRLAQLLLSSIGSLVSSLLNVSASLCVGAHFQHPIWVSFFHCPLSLFLRQLQCDEKLHKKVKET
jgi:hypothetical protein